MLPAKLKRKLAEDKGKPNANEKNDKETVVEAGSDYESDEVILCCYNMCFYLPARILSVLGELPWRNPKC